MKDAFSTFVTMIFDFITTMFGNNQIVFMVGVSLAIGVLGLLFSIFRRS